MDDNITSTELTDPENILSEVHIEDQDGLPIIINTVAPNDLLNQNALTGNVPLFIKKLWKMVNDDNAEDIISWNPNGDGFVIHDQLKFVSQTLPKYFKHNHLSSFVRQLNLYDFHKIQNVDKEEFQFSHPFFLREVPQLLAFIKRKPPTGRPKGPAAYSSEPSSDVQEVMNAVKEIKTKNDVITNELSKLRQENAAVWGEINSLRVKYSKQTKIINKLIHFLISYMQKHHNSRKSGRTVSTHNANKYIKTGPKIMELDYKYKNNPHEFWTDYDAQARTGENGEPEAYTVVEPAESGMEIDSHAQSTGNSSPTMTVHSAIEELLPGSSAFNQTSGSSLDQTLPHIDYTTSRPSSSKTSTSALQRAGGSKENLGFMIDNTQVELNTIKELIKNLTPEEMANFYKLVNDNYKNQEEDMPLDVNPEESELIQNEFIQMAQMSPLNTNIQDQDLTMPLETPSENIQNLEMPLDISENIQNLEIPFEISENIPDLAAPFGTNKSVQDLNIPSEVNENLETDENTFSIEPDELLAQDDLLTNVDRYFN